MKRTLLAAATFFGFTSLVMGGQFNLGEQFQTWNAGYTAPDNGWELWTPISMTFKLDSDLSIYAKGKFGTANYTWSVYDQITTITTTYSQNLTAFTDTVLGGSLRFNNFSIPAVLNISLNLPTGDTSWEGVQDKSIIPTEFVNSRYQGRGFGVNAMYGLSFPMGKGAEMGIAGGYQYSGGYNPNAGISASSEDLKLGDTVFLAMNLAQSYGKIERGVFRLSGSYFLSTQAGGVDTFRMGPAISAAYSWSNPKGFSLDASMQYFFPAQRLNGITLETEPHNSYGPRFFLGPSLAFGDLNVAGRFKYVAPNGYKPGDGLYDGVGGGGVLLGIEPSFWAGFDKESGLRFSVSYDYISWNDAGYDNLGNLADASYNRFTFGTNYEVKW